jgi:hypothetical protein
MKKKAYGKPCVEFTLIAPLQIMAGSPQPPDADSKGNNFFMDDMDMDGNDGDNVVHNNIGNERDNIWRTWDE